MKPSPQFLRHHNVDAPQIDRTAFHPAWRVRSQLDTLLLRADIDPELYRAAERFRRTWLAAFGSLTSSSLKHVGQLSPHNPPIGREPFLQFQALRRIQDIHAKLDPYCFDILIALLIDDLPWVEIARRRKIHRITAKSHAMAALNMLLALKCF
jgi:hypothetical protein